MAEPATPTRTARPVRRAVVALLSLAALGALLLFSNVPLCPVVSMTGHPCPGCGLTRATRALFRGSFEESLRFHPLVLPAMPLLVVWMLLGAWRYVREGRFRSFESARGRWTTVFAAAFAALFFAVWVARFFGAFGGPVPVSSPAWSRPNS